jgi:gluconate 2-dehydrogenase gamma chain
MRSITLRRRQFLQAAATAAAAGAVSCGGRSSPWRFFTVHEAETVAAVSDRIIPADQDAGAASAGVVNYIDRQLKGPFRKYQRVYRQGLIGIDHASESALGKPFTALTPTRQDQLLTLLDTGKAPPEAWNPAQAKTFFDLIRDHTMQGFYGDPRHGGNRDFASWRMMGIPVVPVRGRNLYDLTGAGLASRSRRTTWRSNT